MEPPEDRAAHGTPPSATPPVPGPDGDRRPDAGRPDAPAAGGEAGHPRSGPPLPHERPPLDDRPRPQERPQPHEDPQPGGTPLTWGVPLPQERPAPGATGPRTGEDAPAGDRIPGGADARGADARSASVPGAGGTVTGADGTLTGEDSTGIPAPASASASASTLTGEDGTGPDPDSTGDYEAGALGSLSLPGRLVVALAVAVIAVGAVFHIGMVFLHVAPTNTVSTEHAQAVSDYIYPEFEQNWKLFAPDPVQINTDVEARAAISTPAGGTSTTGWVDLTAIDIAKIRHDPIPSHTVQNELRRAWDFYASAHDSQDRPIGLRGTLSQQYLLRIVAQRFGQHLNGGTVQRFQVRVATTPVASPNWSAQKTATGTSYRLLSWWTVTPEDFT
ncbi:DUF5819 family protein [Streptomyces sp. SL13]|uniref:DUF5819 family protein n=1 Tax=Streptantibioticus silvisoli TaxID=2705255 RepID=A0AA90K993_9ACTN|nr:DUF5819 family protein [Streptantibioticus silvisoli]MDI5970602.1 DUF5819 family protein [Streptantibioticus silvisoli]